MLRVLSFNILAPHFAGPSHYPPGMSNILDQDYRRCRTTKFLLKMKETCDVLGFQEVTHDTEGSYDEFTYLEKILGNDFVGMFCPHEPHYWADYGCYVPNGNALFFRRNLFSEPIWYDVDLFTGNHAIMGEVTHLPTSKKFRVLNVHLDSDEHKQRNYELNAGLTALEPFPDTIDIVLGDFNMEASDPYYPIVRQTGFKDIVTELQIKTPTFAFITDEPIDHILYRDPMRPPITLSCRETCVLDGGIWNKYAKYGPFDTFIIPRLRECIDLHGSDHFPLLAVFRLD